MVHADPFHNYCVALVVPSYKVLENWAQEAGIKYQNFSELCERMKLSVRFNSLFSSETYKTSMQVVCNKENLPNRFENFLFLPVGKAAKLDKFEIPAKIKLLPEPWTPESEPVTAALKIKREQLKAKFKDDLQKMYG
ncbi:hypothetical protein QYF36_022173 [Acer negundo]|nr:hypothetical protein QYF36_022173 [Acer negundo]